MSYKEVINNLRDDQTIADLQRMNIDDDKLKAIAQKLKGSQITRLNLDENNIGCEGIKYLVDVLPYIHQLHAICLSRNHIGDQGLKSLTEVLTKSSVKYVNLSENNITTGSTQSLRFIRNNTDIKIIIDVHCRGTYDRFLSITSDRNRWDICLNRTNIGNGGVVFIQQCLKNIPIGYLQFSSTSTDILETDVEYLSQAFTGLKVEEVILNPHHIFQANGIRHLVKACKNARIEKVDITETNNGDPSRYIANFLKEINIIELDLTNCCIEDEGVKYLGAALKSNTILRLSLRCNHISAKYLAKILNDTDIISLDIFDINLKDLQYIKHLKYSLKNNQVTEIKPTHKLFEGICARKRDNIKKICDLFDSVVSQNSNTDEYEFIVPTGAINVDQHIYLTKTLIQNPNIKAHIFYLYCKIRSGVKMFDFDKYDKLNDFISVIPQMFNKFLNNNILKLLEFNDVNFVKWVKVFEELNQSTIVENLLLHRPLFYVDESGEILHPYIYKMLHKYNMVLYQNELEPNKKNKIIYYFQNNRDFPDAQDFIVEKNPKYCEML